MSRVWITRAEPGAGATARHVRELGHEPIIAPLLEVRPLGEGPIDLEGVAALAFTSANGLRAFAARSKEREQPVFAVGDATAAAARALGFQAVSSAAGDVAALVRLIGRDPPKAGFILHLSARQAAGDLVADLAMAGTPAQRLDVYETVMTELSDSQIDAVALADAILLHSPRASRRLSQGFKSRISRQSRLICLSPAVAAALVGLSDHEIFVADTPDEESLLLRLSAGLASA